jgi:hypothetical protein
MVKARKHIPGEGSGVAGVPSDALAQRRGLHGAVHGARRHMPRCRFRCASSIYPLRPYLPFRLDSREIEWEMRVRVVCPGVRTPCPAAVRDARDAREEVSTRGRRGDGTASTSALRRPPRSLLRRAAKNA